MIANILLVKCAATGQTFGIRAEKRGNDWVSTWAFPIDEARAKREGFDKTKITGSLQQIPEYPGCPHCGGHDLVQCGNCAKMNCYKAESEAECKPKKALENRYAGVSFRCHWCGTMISDIKITESFTVKSGGY